MTTTLREAAARAARPDEAEPAPIHQQDPELDDLPDTSEFEPDEGDPEQVPVTVAWNRVMREVAAIRKGGEGGKFRSKDAGNYDFRGVDRTVNAFGPAFRRHGITLVPLKVEPTYNTGSSKSGGVARHCTVKVTWTIIGPRGDMFPTPFQSCGEALDYSDKSTTKAQSVAERVILLTLGMVPTGDPDPDSVNIELGDASIRSVRDYIKELREPGTSFARIQQIYFELNQQNRLGDQVPTEDGKGNEALKDLVIREGSKRKAREERTQAPQTAAPTAHDHEGDYSPDCDACKAEQAAADRAMAGGS